MLSAAQIKTFNSGPIQGSLTQPTTLTQQTQESGKLLTASPITVISSISSPEPIVTVLNRNSCSRQPFPALLSHARTALHLPCSKKCLTVFCTSLYASCLFHPVNLSLNRKKNQCVDYIFAFHTGRWITERLGNGHL